MKTEYQQYLEDNTRLEELYTDLETVNALSPLDVCRIFQVDCRQEIIDILNHEIDTLEDAVQQYESASGQESLRCSWSSVTGPSF